MTLIECFDESALENIAACLLLPVTKVILLGERSQMESAAQRYRAFLKNRGKNITVELRDTVKKDLKGLVNLLRSIVYAEDKCVIDLNGGDEMTVMAVGAMLAGLDDRQRKKVSVQRLDPETGTIQDCDGDGSVQKGQPAALSVEELIFLHGGIVHPRSFQPDNAYSAADLDSLWEIVTEDSHHWNTALGYLAEIEKYSSVLTDDRMTVFVVIGSLYHVQRLPDKLSCVRELLKKLADRGLIEDHSSENYLDYSFRSPLIRYCTEKAGNVLEVKTLLEARGLKDKGSFCFQDCRMGVSIDWDGKIFDSPGQESIPETRNEIDLILVQGLRPLFISCKNGHIGDDELYKLHTVATHFGGPNVRKMLIATNLNQKSDSANNALIQRAEDMQIYLVRDAAKLSSGQWRQIFRDAMK